MGNIIRVRRNKIKKLFFSEFMKYLVRAQTVKYLVRAQLHQPAFNEECRPGKDDDRASASASAFAFIETVKPACLKEQIK